MPLTRKQIEREFGRFSYQELGNGRIKIEPKWVKENIVDVNLPILGKVKFHKKGAVQLKNVFKEIKMKGLENLIDKEDFKRNGGTFVQRHKNWNKKRGISHHSWGIAIDVNVKDNPYGAKPKMDRRIVKIFEKNGFEWGGRWKTPDGMHFELVSLEPQKPVTQNIRVDKKEKIPSWAEKEIKQLKKLGIIKGYPDGTFKPNKNVTRAELSVILSRLIKKIKTREIWEEGQNESKN